jgi:hypothetical protein
VGKDMEILFRCVCACVIIVFFLMHS